MISDIIIKHVSVPDVTSILSDTDSDSSEDDTENIYKTVHEVPEERMRFVTGTNGETTSAPLLEVACTHTGNRYKSQYRIG